MADFIKQTDYKIDYQCKLVKDESQNKPNFQTLVSNFSPAADEKCNDKDKQNVADTTFFNANPSQGKLVTETGEEFDI